jgi:hypothetical protein
MGVGRGIGLGSLAKQVVTAIAHIGVDLIPQLFDPRQRSISLHQGLAQRQQSANFLGGVTALPTPIGVIEV